MVEIVIDGYPVKNYWATDSKILLNGVRREPSKRLLKLFLLKKYGVCFHCQKPVIDYVAVDKETPPPNSATLDHLKSRKYRRKHEKVEKVLACYECNNQLNHKEQRG